MLMRYRNNAMMKSLRAVQEIFSGLAPQLDRGQGQHLYRQLGSLVRERIQSGDLRPGDAIPSQRLLSQIMQVSEVTIRRALQELAEEGLLEARAGGGTFVLSPGQSSQPGVRTQTPSRRLPFGTLSIGIAFADLRDGYPFFRPMIEGIRDDAPQTISARLFDAPLTGDIGALDLGGIDGVIAMSPVNLDVVTRCHAVGLPCVLLYADIADGRSRCIVVDYAPAILQTFVHLRDRGRRRVALVTASADRFSTGRLTDAYTTAIELNQFPHDPDWIINAGYDERDGYHAMQRLMSLPPDQRPDAVIFASDHPARGALVAAHELSIHVPRDVAIVGAGDLLGPSGWSVPLTTIDLKFAEVGRRARQTLIALIEGQTPPPLRQSIRAELRVGQTT